MRVKALIIPAIALMALMPLAAAETLEQVPTISVSGNAEGPVEPATASFSITASFTEETTEEAMSKASEMANRAVKILTGTFGISEDDLSTSFISVSPEYRWVDDEQVLAGQNATQRIDVSTHDLASIGAIYSELMKLNGISVSDVTLDKEDKSAEYAEARKNAVLDAYAKASAYAEAAGVFVGKVLSISDGSSYAVPLYRSANLMMAKADAAESSAAANYYAGDITVSASVSMVYGIEQ